MGQYQASKLAAHTATLDYISDHNPKYSVVTIHPVFVFGENLLQTTAEELGGTNGMIFGSLYSKEPMFAPYRRVHVLDVAEAHIRALTLDDAPIASFLLAGKDRSWEEVLEFAKKEFPEAGFQTQPETGDRWFVDTTRAEAHLGFAEWRDMEEQVRDVVLQQLKLRSGWDSSRVNLYCECWRKLLQNISAGICHGEQAVNEQKLRINIH
jgi:nucleoside-diphosphate-sugar epimerase